MALVTSGLGRLGELVPTMLKGLRVDVELVSRVNRRGRGA